MPVTRNRLSNNQKSSAICDGDPDSRGQLITTNLGTDSPDDSTRQLRDRNSLPKPAYTSQQQQQQLDTNRGDQSGRVSPSAKKLKPPPSTRVPLPRRSTIRPQSLLDRGGSGQKIDFDSANKNSVNNNQIKKCKYDDLDLGPRSLVTKQVVNNLTGRTQDKTIAGDYAQHDTNLIDASHQHQNHSQWSSFQSNSKQTQNLSCTATLKLSSDQRQVNKNTPPVRISLPSNASSSNNDLNSLNSSDSAKKLGIVPVGVPTALSMTKNSPATTVATLNSHGEIINGGYDQQVQPTSRERGRKNFNVLVAATGSVATVKLIELIRKLRSLFPLTFENMTDNKTYDATISIRVILTENSKHFVGKNEVSKCINGIKLDVLDDADEWINWQKLEDPVLHIELRKWADICLIAPLDANTMAKIANGICDNLLTCVLRAWDTSKKVIYCPAMNVHMYNHPITRDHLCKLQSFGYLRVDCIEKRLACGDFGIGAMAAIDTIIDKVIDNLLKPIPRLTSPTKPILNQQPTYPIMSTSDPASINGVPRGSNLAGRFKSSDHVGLNEVREQRKNSIICNGYSIGQSTADISTSNNLMNKRKFVSQKMHNNNHMKSISASSQARSNLVKSLKNLKAINSDPLDTNSDDNLDGENGEFEDDDDEYDNDNQNDNADFYSEVGLDLSMPGVEGANYDLDPSRLLEQSLITDEDNINFSNELRSRGSIQLNTNSSGSNADWWNDQLQRMDSYTPLFNVSKFLSMCFVKERNIFNCAICKNDYKNRKSMSRHLREQHVQGNIYQCDLCGVGFKRREKLVKHNRDRHEQ